MFDSFPKTRPQLPKEIQKIYSAQYKSNRRGETAASSLSQMMESWLHKQVAKDVLDGQTGKVTLEVGAGTLNQLRYEPKVGHYDIVEPFRELYEGASDRNRIRYFYNDITEVPGNQRYDRITSVATFEHICNLPEVIACCGLLLADNGKLRVSVPSEGSLLWTLGWKLTTGLEFRFKYGLDYGVFMKHEHVNTAVEIEELLRYFFKEVKRNVFGLTASFSLYQFYSCGGPMIERCHQFAPRSGD
jgi:Methyltransferase domain